MKWTQTTGPERDPELLGPFEEYLRNRGHECFNDSSCITVARAPARIDLMGGIADYSGSVVFEGTLGRSAVVGIQRSAADTLSVRSTWLEQLGKNSEVSVELNELRRALRNGGYDAVSDMLTGSSVDSWAAYLIGAIPVLEREEGLQLDSGLNMLLWSDIPVGVGVASSAAIEVATMYAVAGATEMEIGGTALGELAQMVENRIVGAPCGVMDQVTSALGREDELLALRCQPCDLMGYHSLPENVQVYGISSQVEHSVGGDPYTKARISAFMGLKIILDIKTKRGESTGAEDQYLCNVTPPEYVENYRTELPDQMRGEDFLDQFGATTDPVTEVDPSITYNVRAGTEHPIYENYRVQRFIDCLKRARSGDRTALVEAGGMMYASHASYDWNCGLGCPETDLLVDLVRARGPNEGLYGAKVTGGGSGGTVAILADRGSDDLIGNVANDYANETSLTPDIFRSTTPGACQFGHRVYRPE